MFNKQRNHSAKDNYGLQNHNFISPADLWDPGIEPGSPELKKPVDSLQLSYEGSPSISNKILNREIIVQMIIYGFQNIYHCCIYV